MSAFRADEAAERGLERAKRYLINKNGTAEERKLALEAIHHLIDELGPVVEAYPTWHPLVGQHDPRIPTTTPHQNSGYEGLDHTIYFAHGFVTCPYHPSGKAEKVLDSVKRIQVPHAASLSATELNVPLYNSGTRPVVVRCEWHVPLDPGKLVPKRTAIGLMLDQEVSNWHWSSVGETWETMRTYFLGEPHGARSSFFVSQETAVTMKRVWIALAESGLFGPVRY